MALFAAPVFSQTLGQITGRVSDPTGAVRIPKLCNGQNQLFFIANYEALRRRQNSQSFYSVPTAANFTGDFSAFGTPIYDPNGKMPFPNNVIPSTRIDPISQKLLNYYNVANVPGAGLSNNCCNSGSRRSTF